MNPSDETPQSRRRWFGERVTAPQEPEVDSVVAEAANRAVVSVATADPIAAEEAAPEPVVAEPVADEPFAVAPGTPWRTVDEGMAADSVEEPRVTAIGDRLRTMSIESIAWIAMLVITAGTRFYDLNSRALHHDESLHAYYSWLFAKGDGYTHDPLMHGPLLFFLNAFSYLLFGVSDASSRYMPAIFGVALVGLPYLLRGAKHLGRWGALAAGFFLMISPSMVYYSRYIRHDIFTVVLTLLFFICIVRYIDVSQRRWLVIGGASLAMLLANHEIIFAILAIFFGFAYMSMFIGRLRTWWTTDRRAAYEVLGVHAGAAFLALAMFVLMPSRYSAKLLDIPWDNPTPAQERGYYRHVLTNPLAIAMVLIGVAFIAGMVITLKRARNSNRANESVFPALLDGAQPNTFEHGVLGMWRDRTGLVVAIIVAIVLFIALFTTLFTNLHGLSSSTIATDGTLLYWLGQHDYRRGDQPWFYYLVFYPQYEWIGMLFGGVAVIGTLWRGLGVLTARWSGGRNLQFRLFLIAWWAGIFAGVSFAGEKMPWLIIHITLPSMLLAAIPVGSLIQRTVAAAQKRDSAGYVRKPRLEWGLSAFLLVMGAAWLLLAARITAGMFIRNSNGRLERVISPNDADRWWLLAVPPVIAILAIAATWVWRGPRRAGQAVLAATLIGLTLLQIHTGWRMAYQEGDIPYDMMIYTQSSPDIERFQRELDQFSTELTGGKHVEIWFDNSTSWPMNWYLRDYDKRRFFGGPISAPPENAPILIVGNDNLASMGEYLKGYTRQEYVLRWWFPEDEIYRHFALAPELQPGLSAWKTADQPHGLFDVVSSIASSLGTQLTPEGQLRVYRLAMYRELPATIGSYNFSVFVRNDLVPLYNGIRY